jgi:hypothetical protein
MFLTSHLLFPSKLVLFGHFRPWGAFLEYLYTCAVLTVQSRAFGMVWSSSYDQFSDLGLASLLRVKLRRGQLRMTDTAVFLGVQTLRSELRV